MAPQKNWPTWLAYGASIALFLVLASYAVMYATGYRFDFTTGALKKTGVVAITSKPSGATVTINERHYTRKTPFTLRNVLPGAYHIKLELENYRTYEKDIEVLSNQVSEEHNIDLVLNEILQNSTASDVAALISLDSDIYYFDTAKKFMKAGDSPTQLTFDRLPTNIRNILSKATGLYLATKHKSSNTWTLGVISGGQRWLVVADLTGYRGYIVGTPLNQVKPDDLFWINESRLMLVIGSSLYTLDMTLNKINLYAKNIYGATYAQGKTYYIVKNPQGKYVLMLDNNMFDDRPAKEVTDTLPTGRDHEILITSTDEVVITTTNWGVKSLWLLAEPDEATTDTTQLQLAKLASQVGDVLYDYTNEQLLYVVGRDVVSYSFDKDDKLNPEKKLNSFAIIPRFVGKRNESVFLTLGNKLCVAGYDVENIYELGDITGASVFLAPTSRYVWILKNGELEAWMLRENGQNILGRWSGLWFGENYKPDASSAENILNTAAE